MEGVTDSIQEFFSQMWSFASNKHNQGLFNTICLVVLLTLPLLVFLTALVICCHCCCCRQGRGRCSCCCCSCCDRQASETSRLKMKKKKSSGNTEEDLWISVKSGPTTPDRVALAME